MFDELKKEWRILRENPPGSRFQARHRYRKFESPSPVWKKILVIALGFALIPVGMALWFLPGPGWLTILAGFALLAGYWESTSRFLDGTEMWLRRIIARFRRRKGRGPSASGSTGPDPAKIEFRPIGIIHSPFTKLDGMPIQPPAAGDAKGTVEVFEEFRAGLADLEGFSHIALLYHFHRSHGFELGVVPFLDSRRRGLFATRAPRRPNPIGLSIVRLDRVEGCVLHVKNVDILDGTPLLDIKPYVPRFDERPGARAGWLEQAGESLMDKESDGRFDKDG